MKKLAAVIVGLMALFVVALVFALRESASSGPSGWLVFPDGSSNRIVAVTYGTKHIIGPPLGRMMAHLPQAVQDELPVLIHRTDTPKPALVVWIERRDKSGRSPAGLGGSRPRLSDGDGFVSGTENSPAGCFGNPGIIPAVFEIFPRRDPKLTVNFFSRLPTGELTNCGSLQFPNPMSRSYPEWQSESLPATKRAGDVEVTIMDVRTGYDTMTESRPCKGGGIEVVRGTNRFDGANNTDVKLEIRSLSDSNQIWKIEGVQLSDATGNNIHSAGIMWDGAGPSFAFSPGLWPSEKAWKLQLEIKQAEGFKPENLFTFKNVPLGALDASNAVGWITNFDGVTITMLGILRRPPNTNSSWYASQLSTVTLTNSTLPSGTQLDLLSVAYDQETTNSVGDWQSEGNQRSYFFRQIPLNAKTADFTFAVHQSRFVDFIVHPELPTPAVKAASR